MNATNAYSAKAFLYARYRWDYAPEALEALFAAVPLGPAATIVDLAAGTGILTRRLLGHAGRLLAIEPDPRMAPYARLDDRPPQGKPAILTLQAAAEAIPLPEGCTDLVTVAQAVHWFDPAPARDEIQRILRPGGWLAMLNNRPEDTQLSRALEQALALLPDRSPEPALPDRRPASQPPEYFFAGNAFERRVFPFRFRQNFAAYLGGLVSASFNPTPGDPNYPAFEQAAGAVFERFAEPDGQIEMRGATSLLLGRCHP